MVLSGSSCSTGSQQGCPVQPCRPGGGEPTHKRTLATMASTLNKASVGSSRISTCPLEKEIKTGGQLLKTYFISVLSFLYLHPHLHPQIPTTAASTLSSRLGGAGATGPRLPLNFEGRGGGDSNLSFPGCPAPDLHSPGEAEEESGTALDAEQLPYSKAPWTPPSTLGGTTGVLKQGPQSPLHLAGHTRSQTHGPRRTQSRAQGGGSQR